MNKQNVHDELYHDLGALELLIELRALDSVTGCSEASPGLPLLGSDGNRVNFIQSTPGGSNNTLRHSNQSCCGLKAMWTLRAESKTQETPSSWGTGRGGKSPAPPGTRAIPP